MSRDNGGMAARRAILRWAFRMYRRDWRSQAVVLLLLTISVAGAAFGIATTYNIAGSSDATFGRAANFLRYDGADPAQLADRLARTEQWFGTVEEIGHRYAPVPGLFDQVDIRAQQPDGIYGAPMLALREGHYPRGAGDIALTETVAASLKGTVGQTVSLDGKTWTVTGIVENPADLSDRFALVDPAAAGPPQQVTVLVDGTHENLEAFRGTLSGLVIRQSRPTDERTVTAVLVLALATVGLLLVSLVAAAGYLVAAQRRLRQLGLLAAIGATGRHLRLTLLVNGFITGTFSAITGTVIGVAAWIGVAPLVETGAGHRIGRFDLPWPILGAGMLLAVLTATAAAWWPARTAARVPVMAALSGRPPAPKPARRSAILALVLLALGAVVLYLSGGTKSALCHRRDAAGHRRHAPGRAAGYPDGRGSAATAAARGSAGGHRSGQVPGPVRCRPRRHHLSSGHSGRDRDRHVGGRIHRPARERAGKSRGNTAARPHRTSRTGRRRTHAGTTGPAGTRGDSHHQAVRPGQRHPHRHGHHPVDPG